MASGFAKAAQLSRCGLLPIVEIPLTDLSEVVGFHVVIEVAPDVFLQLVIALLGIR